MNIPTALRFSVDGYQFGSALSFGIVVPADNFSQVEQVGFAYAMTRAIQVYLVHLTLMQLEGSGYTYEDEQVHNLFKRLVDLYHYDNFQFTGTIQTAVDSLFNLGYLPNVKRNEKSIPVRTPKPGYIYLVQAITPDNHYKIGLSKDPITRIESMGVKLPFPVDTLHTFKTDDMTQTEKILHERFADKRVNGEWFELSQIDVSYICSISGVVGGQVYHD